MEKKTSQNLYSSLWTFLRGYLQTLSTNNRKGYYIIVTSSHDIVTLFICFRYNEASLENKPYRLKDGALLAVGTLCDKLRQTEPYKSELENMLVQHVFPEFSSPAGHLRAKVLVTSFLTLKPPSCPFLLCKLYFYSLSFMHVLEDVLRFFSILPNACISL